MPEIKYGLFKKTSVTKEFNPNHDSDGKFGSGGAGSGSSVGSGGSSGGASGASSVGGSPGIAGGSASEFSSDEYNQFNRQVRQTRSPETYDAVQDYQSSATGYQSTNSYLRGSSSMSPAERKDADRITKGLDKAFDRAPALNRDILVHRGVDVDRFGTSNANDLVGKTLTDRGFVSTSATRNVAKNFSKKSNPAYMEISVRRGTKVLTPNGITSSNRFRGEREILLKRNSSFKITGSRKDGAYTVIQADHVS